MSLGALTSLTGGGGLSNSSSATATSGDAKGGTQYGSGISSPIVIGGYKTDGSASGTNTGTILLVAGCVAVAIVLVMMLRK